ncbi:MAG: hypothetical protein WA183_19040 [Chthoniobacterales bacterium]
MRFGRKLDTKLCVFFFKSGSFVFQLFYLFFESLRLLAYQRDAPIENGENVVGRMALTDAAFFEKRTEMVAIDWFAQVIMESGRSRLIDIGRIGSVLI